MNRKELAQAAAFEALRVRARIGLALTDPANPIEIAEKLGIEVWFQRLASAEGLLIRAPHPVILLSSARPSGRIAFTCAHELAHYCFRHLGHIDVQNGEAVLQEDSDDEYQANTFAAYLLMPKTAVQFAFAQRNSKPDAASPLTLLSISHWLGVGYSTLVNHLQYTLGLISGERARVLLRQSPKEIIGDLAGERSAGTSVFIVDRMWRSRPVDLEVGDRILVDAPISISGQSVQSEGLRGEKIIVAALRPGTGHLDGGQGWACYVRVRRSRFEGRSIFRHMEEINDA